MKAVLIEEARNFGIAERDIPLAGPRDVKIRVRVAAICASDKNAFRGVSKIVTYPFIPGRNVAGEIVALGSQVNGFELGDHVAVDPVVSCGVCGVCIAGYKNICENLQVIGMHREGGMAEYISVPASNAYIVPKNWPWEKVVMVEPFAVAANILSRVACAENDMVLILGAGSVSLNIIIAAKHLGAKVAVADVIEARLLSASKFGADLTLNLNDEAFDDKVLEWTDFRGISAGVDILCLCEFFERLQKLAAPRGRLVHLGFSEEPINMIPIEINRKELSIVGSRLNCGMFPKVIEWFSSWKFEPEALVSHSFPYTEIQEAMSLIEESPVNVTRVLLTF